MTSESRGSGVLALMNDLIFETKLRATARTLGVEVRFVKNAAEVAPLLDSYGPSLLIVDLNSSESAFEAISTARAHRAKPKVTAYVAHVDEELARRAGALADLVLPRSKFVHELPGLLQLHGGRPVIPDPSI